MRWIAAGFALEWIWLFACEAWREPSPVLLAVLVVGVGAALAFSWRAFVHPRSWRGGLYLAGVLVVIDELLDVVSPYPARFGVLGWEAMKVAVVVGGFWLGSRVELPRWARIACTAVCTLSVAFAALVPATIAYIAIDGSRDRGEHADAALVLGFALADDGSARPQLVGRIAHAVDLYKRGVVAKLVLSGGVGKNGHTEASVMRDLALAAGVPPDALVLDEDARSTIENFACARPLLDRLGAHSVLVVTEPWHMTRAMLLARRHGLPAAASPASSEIWESPRHAAYWLFRDAVAYMREVARDPFAEPGTCNAHACEGCRTF